MKQVLLFLSAVGLALAGAGCLGDDDGVDESTNDANDRTDVEGGCEQTGNDSAECAVDVDGELENVDVDCARTGDDSGTCSVDA